MAHAALLQDGGARRSLQRVVLAIDEPSRMQGRRRACRRSLVPLMASSSRIWQRAAVGLFFLLSGVSAEVIQLTPETFEDRVGDGRPTPWFIKFYAPWCGACKVLAKDWEQLAEKLGGSVNIAEIDVIAHPSLGEEWVITGFPTLVYISDNRSHEYSGSRNLEAFEEYLLKAPKPEAGWPLPRHRTKEDWFWHQARVYFWELILPLFLVFGLVGPMVGWVVWSEYKKAKEDEVKLAEERAQFREEMHERIRKRREKEQQEKASGEAADATATGPADDTQGDKKTD
eukprot:TRINITY_DN32295_c0_g1_i1.p1 TRINITY_DN32295_c0_g1~~TRINITY_DN32295_c0_g1_i1.p1  ORF type:complete len:285 (-),score=62.69 TRINITY_DN32295_c0_g1_i1:34-888(-)